MKDDAQMRNIVCLASAHPAARGTRWRHDEPGRWHQASTSSPIRARTGIRTPPLELRRLPPQRPRCFESQACWPATAS